MTDLRGVLPALVTPVNNAGVFMPDRMEALLNRLYLAGMHGVYVCGQTGEGPLQTVPQRKAVTEAVIGCSPSGKKVIVHVGSNRTDDAIELARHASRAGAHALSALPPAGSYSFAEVKSFYEAVAQASEAPFLVYYYPEICPLLVGAQPLLELCAIPNVVGLKFTDYDLFTMSAIRESGAAVFNGRDEIFAAGLLMGADGGIGTFYNLIPDLFLEVYELAAAGNWEASRTIQRRINELIRIALQFPALAAVKTMLRWSGVDCGSCLPPRRQLSTEEETALRHMLAHSSFREAPFSPGSSAK